MTQVHVMIHLLCAPMCVTNAEGQSYRFQEVILRGVGENEKEWFNARISGDDIDRIGDKLMGLPVSQQGLPQGEFVATLKHNYSVSERDGRTCYYSRLRLLDIEPVQQML